MKVTQLCLTLWPHIHRNPQVRILEWVAIPFSRGSSQLMDQTQVSRIADDSLPAEPPGKPKNTGVGSLSLLQQIFLTQELNQGLLHRRWILYQLSHMGMMAVTTSKLHEEVLKWEFRKEWVHVYVWLSLFIVHLKLSQHCLLIGYGSVSRSDVSSSLQLDWPEPPGLLCPWNSPGKNPGVGSCSLPQGIFPIQELNAGLPALQEGAWATKEAPSTK